MTCDDTQGLRNAMKCLCDANTEGEFGSCCISHSNGDSLTLLDGQCFISELYVYEGKQSLAALFVFSSFFFQHIFDLS